MFFCLLYLRPNFRNLFRSASELMTVLRPLFKLDTKTQRGFMACVKWEDLEMATREENILLEIKLATLHHYFDSAWDTAEVVNEICLLLFVIF